MVAELQRLETPCPSGKQWSHITDQIGMFAFTGIVPFSSSLPLFFSFLPPYSFVCLDQALHLTFNVCVYIYIYMYIYVYIMEPALHMNDPAAPNLLTCCCVFIDFLFFLIGLTSVEVNYLREVHSIYLTADGRMSLAGLSGKDVGYVAAGIDAARRQ